MRALAFKPGDLRLERAWVTDSSGRRLTGWQRNLSAELGWPTATGAIRAKASHLREADSVLQMKLLQLCENQHSRRIARWLKRRCCQVG